MYYIRKELALMFSNPFYYIILSVALIAMAVLLCWMIRRRKHDEKVIREYQQKMDELRRQKEAEQQEQAAQQKPKKYRTYREQKEAERRAPANPQNYYTTYNEREEYIPKYAAGCDMDRITRPVPSEPKDSILVPIVCIVVMLAALISPYLDKHNIVKLPGSQPAIEHLIGNLKAEIQSTEWSDDGKSLIIVTTYTNESAASCRNARTSFELLGENGVVLQTYQGENLGMVTGYETVEQTTIIPLEVNRTQIKQISGKVEYFS